MTKLIKKNPELALVMAWFVLIVIISFQIV